MKVTGWIVAGVVALVALGVLSGRSVVQGAPTGASVVAEGVIYSVSFIEPSSQIIRLTRDKNFGNGRSLTNVDAYGVLTNDFLIITYPGKKDLAEDVIPVRSLREVQFGMGGITKIEENAKP